MFDIPTASTALHQFIETNSEALQNAALLLGGRSWLRRVQALIDELRFNASLTDRIQREVLALNGLLTLEHVHDIERPEAAYFAMLDPAAPYVEDICLLVEGLKHALKDTAVMVAVSCSIQFEENRNG